MKRIINILLIIVLCFPFFVYANNQLKDGWHLLKCQNNSKNCWAYYKNGVEKKRVSKIIYIHGGWPGTPDNSIDSLKAMKKNGYYGLTTDVHFTKDHVPVLLHDDYINDSARNSDYSKITGSRVYLHDLTLNELNSKYVFPIDHDGNYLEKYKTNKITTYEDAIKYCHDYGMTMEVEIKEASESDIDILLNITKKYNMNGGIKWTSFHGSHIKWLNSKTTGELIQYFGPNMTDDEARDFYQNHIKDNRNTMIVGSSDGSYVVPIETSDIKDYPANKYDVSVIPQAKIEVENNINLTYGENKVLNYNYAGDSNINCASSDNNNLPCQIDTTRKLITINPKNIGDIKLTLNTKQTTNYSASKDIVINIKVNKFKPIVQMNDVNYQYTGIKKGNKASVTLTNNETYNSSINYYYFNNNECKGEKLSEEPINAGNYSVIATINEFGNYEHATSNCAKITIDKIEAQLDVNNDITIENKETTINYQYNGDGQIICENTDNHFDCSIDETNKIIKVSSKDNQNGLIKIKSINSTNYKEVENNINVTVHVNTISINSNFIVICLIIIVLITLIIVIIKMK